MSHVIVYFLQSDQTCLQPSTGCATRRWRTSRSTSPIPPRAAHTGGTEGTPLQVEAVIRLHIQGARGPLTQATPREGAGSGATREKDRGATRRLCPNTSLVRTPSCIQLSMYFKWMLMSLWVLKLIQALTWALLRVNVEPAVNQQFITQFKMAFRMSKSCLMLQPIDS